MFRHLILVLVFVLTLPLAVKCEENLVGPEFTLLALQRMRGPYVYPAELKTVPLLNAALYGLEQELTGELKLVRIPDGADDLAAKQIFEVEFRKAIHRAQAKGGIHKLALAFAATRAMLASLGRSHTFIHIFDNLNEHLSSSESAQIKGVPVLIENLDGLFYVDYVWPDSQAYRIGLRRLDVVRAIEGRPPSGAAMRWLRGPAYTSAGITVSRSGESDQEFWVLRETQSESETGWFYKIVSGRRLVFCHFRYFGDEVPSKIAHAISREKVDGIVLDLRGNIGGNDTSLDPLMSMFLPDGAILYQTKSAGGSSKTRTKKALNHFPDLPMAVLIDSRSGSSAEIFAGVLQEYCRAIIVGEKSAGRVERARTLNLPYCTALWVTNGEVLTPKGQILEGRGVVPDIPVYLTKEDVLARRDPPLNRAEAELIIRLKK